jgi:hypothetical protein
MSDRTLVKYEEPRSHKGPYWGLTIERSAAGQPGLFFTISHRSFDGTLKGEELTVMVDDGRALLAPVIEWLNQEGPDA